MHSCYEMYHRTSTGLAPEIVHFQTQGPGFPKEHAVRLESVC